MHCISPARRPARHGPACAMSSPRLTRYRWAPKPPSGYSSCDKVSRFSDEARLGDSETRPFTVHVVLRGVRTILLIASARMTESALRWPGCGAPATDGSAACDYCGAALATATCLSCFGAMFVGTEESRVAVLNRPTTAADGYVDARSVYWLFCRAKTGMNSRDASREAEHAFDRLFDIPFESSRRRSTTNGRRQRANQRHLSTLSWTRCLD